MKQIPNIAAAFLGLVFLGSGLNFLLNFLPMLPGPPEGSPADLFMGALLSTGYLGPIVVNIVACHVFPGNRTTLPDPVSLGVTVLAAMVFWSRRNDFGRLTGRFSAENEDLMRLHLTTPSPHGRRFQPVRRR